MTSASYPVRPEPGRPRERPPWGLRVGDYRNDGLIDLYAGTFSDDYKPLFRNDGKANFTEISPDMGIAEPTFIRFSHGPPSLSITTTTAGRICSRLTATSIRRRISTNGAHHMPSAHTCSTI